MIIMRKVEIGILFLSQKQNVKQSSQNHEVDEADTLPNLASATSWHFKNKRPIFGPQPSSSFPGAVL